MRLLKPEEIEVRVATVKENGFSLLLYKSARVDMQMLDEEYGEMNWQRKHELIGDRLYCTISIYNEKTGQWISKQDVGTESYTEKEKGQASDSFKRAGFNWNIGRELYTSPFIWINNEGEVQNYKGKLSVQGRFHVAEVEYDENRNISKLAIKDNKGKVRYSYGSTQAPQRASTKKKVEQVASTNKEPEKASEGFICNKCGVEITKKVNDYSEKKYSKALCMTCQKGE